MSTSKAANNVGKLATRVSLLESRFGYVVDAADNSAALQAAVNSLASTGGLVEIPDVLNQTLYSTGIQIPYGVYLHGSGDYGTRLRYTGSGAAISADGTGMNSFGLRNLTIDVTQNNAICLDAARCINGDFDNVRFRCAGGTGTVGVQANITNPLWTSYNNRFRGCTFDGAFAKAVYMDSSTTQHANRWRFESPFFLNCVNCFDLNSVQGISIMTPNFNEHTGTAIKLGASVDRAVIIGAEQESSSGGGLFSINAAANRTKIIGYTSFAGTVFVTAGIGVNGVMVCDDIESGISFSGSSNPAIIAKMIVDSDNGLEFTGSSFMSMIAIAAASVPINSLFKNSADGKLYFKDSAGTSQALY